MKMNISIARLSIGLKAFFFEYRKDIKTILLIVLAWFIVTNIYPTSVLYQYFLAEDPKSVMPQLAEKLVFGNYAFTRQITFLPILFLLLIIYNFISNQTSRVSRNLLPLSPWENCLALTIGSIGITLLIFIEIYLLDAATTQLYRSLFYKETLAILQQKGQLYPYITTFSYFEQIPYNFYKTTGTSIFNLFLIFTIGLLYFKNQSFLKLFIIILLVGFIMIFTWYSSSRTYNQGISILPNGSFLFQYFYQFLYFTLGLWIIKNLFQENQV
ncbi:MULTISPECIES: hypothetical protein [unclassified Sphingobacterium]|uniref:hypothetical protein n=1 Tax=unclassified Sphingobacterium TaxID=2609468 RepID=UPI001047309B|nr:MULTISPECIES: hypothetical protein [unclassified Sphingobacterium]MCS3554966.1 hypothetical protein [Sphingobacterium sp. JUb21]TCR05637.1 hypothetical protein EDF66_106105 [Sphingobacterium sp. JUb20]